MVGGQLGDRSQPDEHPSQAIADPQHGCSTGDGRGASQCVRKAASGPVSRHGKMLRPWARLGSPASLYTPYCCAFEASLGQGTGTRKGSSGASAGAVYGSHGCKPVIDRKEEASPRQGGGISRGKRQTRRCREVGEKARLPMACAADQEEHHCCEESYSGFHHKVTERLGYPIHRPNPAGRAHGRKSRTRRLRRTPSCLLARQGTAS
jgi:hypothetical protein